MLFLSTQHSVSYNTRKKHGSLHSDRSRGTSRTTSVSTCSYYCAWSRFSISYWKFSLRRQDQDCHSSMTRLYTHRPVSMKLAVVSRQRLLERLARISLVFFQGARPSELIVEIEAPWGMYSLCSLGHVLGDASWIAKSLPSAMNHGFSQMPIERQLSARRRIGTHILACFRSRESERPTTRDIRWQCQLW